MPGFPLGEAFFHGGGSMEQENRKEKKERKGLSGSTLKIIAMVTMLIDHSTAVLLEGTMTNRFHNGLPIGQQYFFWDMVLRGIGRVAFPIYCFLLIEGIKYTKNMKKYVMRLGIFALVSEVFFDLAFHRTLVYIDYQNVFFTLFLGVLAILCIKKIEQKTKPVIVDVILTIIITAIFAAIATILKTDYSYYGIVCIVAFYAGRATRIKQFILGGIAFWFEFPLAQLSFIPLAFYNGKRGLSLKYLYYFFYPVHLFILFIIAKILGIY